jgi:hypothetical protein
VELIKNEPAAGNDAQQLPPNRTSLLVHWRFGYLQLSSVVLIGVELAEA